MARKGTSKPTQDEHVALEAAMKELAKQTDALLSKTKESKDSAKPKPVLPKKRIVPHRQGAHLDIVGHNSPRRLVSVHHPASKNSVPELLPEHAGYSFNEKAIQANGVGEARITAQTEQPVATKSNSPQIVKSHASGVVASGVSSDQLANEPERELSTHKVIKPVQHHPNSVVASRQQESPPSLVREKPVETDEKKEKIHFEKPAPLKVSSVASEADDALDESGIIKDRDMNLGEEIEVAEFQAQLHDWSKLSRKTHWPLIVLLLLTLAIAAAAYLYFTDTLPQL